MENQIEIMRKRKGLTQEQLANLLGCNQGVIQKIEKGVTKLTVDWMRKIAQVLGCEAWELLPKDMQPQINPNEVELLRLLRVLSNNTVKTDNQAEETKAG